MRALTTSEKRTVRYAAIGLAIYLALFVSAKVLGHFVRRHHEYLEMVAEARQLKIESRLEEAQAAVVERLMTDFNLDPAALSTNSVVADASAAMQNAAQQGGVKLGTIREAPGRASAKESATIQIEGSGPVAAVIALLRQLPLLGYPLVIDSVQISADPMRPGQIKLNVTVIVLNFEPWKQAELTHA